MDLLELGTWLFQVSVACFHQIYREVTGSEGRLSFEPTREYPPSDLRCICAEIWHYSPIDQDFQHMTTLSRSKCHCAGSAWCRCRPPKRRVACPMVKVGMLELSRVVPLGFININGPSFRCGTLYRGGVEDVIHLLALDEGVACLTILWWKFSLHFNLWGLSRIEDEL